MLKNIKISILGVIGAIFGFSSLIIPWLIITVDAPIIGTVNIGIFLKPYTALFAIDLFENLVIGQILMLFGSILTLIFLNKLVDGEQETKYDKTPIIGLIGAILNGLAIFTFFFVLINEAPQPGIEINAGSIQIQFGLISAIFSVVICMVAFLVGVIKNKEFLNKFFFTIQLKGSRE